MSEHYILEGRKTVSCDLMTLAKAMNNVANRRIERTQINDEVHVSTVFLGLDHSFGEGPPLLFETMVFGGDMDQEEDRYTTYDQAEAGHKAMVERASK